MSDELSVYDVLTVHLTEIKTELISLRDEQIIQGKSIAGLKAQVFVVYTIVLGVVIAIMKLWINGVSS